MSELSELAAPIHSWRRVMASFLLSEAEPQKIRWSSIIRNCMKWHVAFQLVQHLVRLRVRLNVSQYNSVISTSQFWSQALRSFQGLILAERPDIISLNTLAGCVEHRWNLALCLLRKARESLQQVDRVTFHGLLKSLNKRDSMDKRTTPSLWTVGLESVHMMKRQSISLRRSTYTHILQAMALSNKWHKLICFLPLIRIFDFDAVCCNVAVHACSKALQWKAAMNLLWTLPQLLVRPDAVSYNALTEGQWRHACTIMQEMMASNIRANMKWYNHAGYIVAGAKHWANTIAMFQSAQDLQNRPDTVTVNTCLNLSGQRWDWALARWVKMAKGQRSDQVTCQAWLSILTSTGAWIESLAFLQELFLNSHKLSGMVSSAAAKSIGSDCWTAAFNLLQDTDVTTYSAAVEGFEEHLWPNALQLIEIVSSAGLQNDVVFLNSGLDVLGADQWNFATSLFDSILTVQLQASQTSHCSVLAHANPWQNALTSFNTFRAAGVHLDTASYNAVFAICDKFSQWRECLCFLEAMGRDEEQLADEVTYNAVISACEKGERGVIINSIPIRWLNSAGISHPTKMRASGGAAAQALRALRRAAQLHTERRASVAKPTKSDAPQARTRGRGRAMLGSSQPDPVPCSQPTATQPSSQLPSSQLPSSQMASSQLPSSQLPLSQADALPADKCGSQRDPRDLLASMSTQTPLSNVPPSSLDTLPASQALLGIAEAAPAKQVPLRIAPEAPSSFQAPQSGVAEAAAALAAALATFAGSGASQEVVRRRYRCKAPPPGRSSPQSSIRQCSPSPTPTPHRRKRKPARKIKSQAEVIKEVSSKTIWSSVSKLNEDIRNMEKERAAHRTRCQKAATEALRLLADHQKACKESSEAFTGTAKAADAALAAVAALERSQGPETSRHAAAAISSQSSIPAVLSAPGQLRKRVRRIDGITSSCI